MHPPPPFARTLSFKSEQVSLDSHLILSEKKEGRKKNSHSFALLPFSSRLLHQLMFRVSCLFFIFMCPLFMMMLPRSFTFEVAPGEVCVLKVTLGLLILHSLLYHGTVDSPSFPATKNGQQQNLKTFIFVQGMLAKGRLLVSLSSFTLTSLVLLFHQRKWAKQRIESRGVIRTGGAKRRQHSLSCVEQES